MDRRGFLGSLIGGVAATAAVRTWPFRVFSFPDEIIVPHTLPIISNQLLSIDMITRESLRVLMNSLTFTEFARRDYPSSMPIGSVLNIRKPARFTYANV